MPDPKPGAHDVSNAAEMRHASAKRPFNWDAGEDEDGAPDEGDDSGIRDDQKPISGNSRGSQGNGEQHKTGDLTKAGRDIDPMTDRNSGTG